VNDVLSQGNWDRARVIVEYGPGVGTITQEILKRMRPNAVLVAIELNSDFVDFLTEKIDDPRLRVVHDDVRRNILKQTRELLSPDGALLVYQFTSTVLPYLKSNFGSVEQNVQLLNILPARIFYCTP
jgi:phospholipid N-methyltransferase